MITKGKSRTTIFFLIVVVLMVSLACNFSFSTGGESPTRTPELEQEMEEVALKTRTPESIAAAVSDTPTNTPEPTSTPAPSVTPEPPTLTPSVTPLPCNFGQYVMDVTIPDNTEISANTGFTKTWQLKNIGSCAWTSGYKLIFDHGDRMNAPDSVQLTNGQIPPGSTVNVSVNLTAPADGGAYTGYFKMRSPEGQVFGIGNNGQGAFFVQIISVEAQAVQEADEPEPVVEKKPDLFVQSITLNPNPPTQGQGVTVKVAVYNQGNAAAGAYTVVWYAGENFPAPACSWPVDKSNANGGRVLTCNYAGYNSWYGSLNTKAIVDANGQVNESNEGNNVLKMNIQVLKP